jgi:hypothetical protein
MKLKEAMGYASGGHELMHPSTNMNVQVVQPRTRQAYEPSQSGKDYEKAKKVNKKTRKDKSFDKYTEIETDEIENYYDYESETDNEITKRIKKLSNKKKKEDD